MDTHNTENTATHTACNTLSIGGVENFKRNRAWALTSYNVDQSAQEYYKSLPGKKVIGLETCPDTGRLHLQMYYYYNNAREFTVMQKDFPGCRFRTAYKCTKANVIYCTKETVIHNDWPEYEKRNAYKGNDLPQKEQLYPWQLSVLDIINQQPDDRTINWIWEPDGNVGKTKFCKYLAYNHQNICLTTATKSADILTCVEPHFKTYIFDFPRCVGDFTPWNAIEQIKNGFVTDSKLKKKSQCIMFEPPHVLIFANHPPKLDKLSLDRWNICKIVDKKLSKHVQEDISIDYSNHDGTPL